MEFVGCNLCGAWERREIYPDTRIYPNGSADWDAYRCTYPGYGVHPPIVQCMCCGLIYTSPRARRDIVVEKYKAVADPLYLQERWAREITFRRHLQTLERFTGPGAGKHILDVGAYIGVFVEEAQKAGWQAWGLEPSAWGASYAREQGLNVVHGLLETAEFEPSSFDALTMWDVIEHLGNPQAGLRQSYRLLKPGGWIAVHTMDIDSLFARLMGARWPWLMEMHIYYFSRQTLRLMLERVGFRVACIKPEGRFLRLKYLTTRLRPYSRLMADWIDRVAKLTGVDRVPLPINFGDLITAYAQKPEE